MRVLMLSDVYFPRINGVSTAIQTYLEQLDATGIETHLIAPQYDEPLDNESNVQRLPGWTVPLDREDRIVRPGSFKRAAIEAAQGCDIIHIHTPFAAHGAGIAAARAHGLPVVATYHTLFEEYLHLYMRFLPHGMARRFARRISRHQCNQLDAVVVPSTLMEERLRGYGVGAPMHVLPTGIPVSRFGHGDRKRFRLQYGIADEQTVALYVGRAAHEKNIEFLIDTIAEAAKTSPKLLLLIAGEGPALEHLRTVVHHQNLESLVRFVGYLDRGTELPDCYAAADMFVFASRTETQGLVLLEAMAAGLPVVALAEMGTCDILKPASGALTPQHDIREFAAAINRIARDANLRKRCSMQARSWAREWSDVALTHRLAELYTQLANRLDVSHRPQHMGTVP